MRTDCGGEFIGEEVAGMLRKQGIQHQKSPPYTPQLNGESERANRTIITMARCMLRHARLPATFWHMAVAAAVFVKNRLPHRALPTNTTPHELWHGVKPDLSILRTFGCVAHALVQGGSPAKFDARSKSAIFVGYAQDEGMLAYKLYDPHTRRFFNSRNVKFDETAFGALPDDSTSQVPLQVHDWEMSALAAPAASTDEQQAEQQPQQQQQAKQQPQQQQEEEHGIEQRRTRTRQDWSWIRSERNPAKYRQPQALHVTDVDESADSDIALAALLQDAVTTDSPTLQEALSGPDAAKWRDAIQEELDALSKNGVYKIDHCSTDDITVDILTKALPPEKHNRHMSELGLIELETQ